MSQTDSSSRLSSLTPREAQVLELIAQGFTNGEVAQRLDVTVHAVKFHLTSIYRKLDVANRTAAASLYQTQTTTTPRQDPPPQHNARRQAALARPIALDLPTDRPRSPDRGSASGREERPLEPRLEAALHRRAAEQHVQVESLLLAALGAFLSRYTRQENAVVGYVSSWRPSRPVQTLWLDLAATLSFAEFVDHVDLEITQCLGEAWEQHDVSGNGAETIPHTQVVFGCIRGGQTIDEVELLDRDFALIFEERSEALTATLHYDADLFEAATSRRMLDELVTLIESGLENPPCPIGLLALVAEDERRLLLETWNETRRPYPDARTDQIVAERARERPNAIAVEFEGNVLTYSELDAGANRLAHVLQEHGVGPDVLVGICTERSLEMLVGLLAIMRSGGAYVPIDPAFPSDRQRFMLEDAEVGVVITQAHLLETLPLDGVETICFDRDAARIAASSNEAPACAATPANLAYVIYTSGSTGRPKGVQVPHRALVSFLTTMGVEPGFDKGDVLVALTTLSFDIAALELYLPLVRGGRVVIAPQTTAADPHALSALIKRVRATVVQATPTTWRMLVDSGWAGQAGMKALCGGEALPAELAAALLDRRLELWNMYGPTETTIWSTVCRLDRRSGVTIGRPIGNTVLYILDEHLQPVPIGVPGELHIGGDGLAYGYLKRPQLTAERFIESPFAPDPNTRLYKTGDLARYRADGHVEFLGRLDHQVKVRGFRIELGEIETALALHPAIRTAVVSTREDAPGDVRLVGYVIPNGERVPVAELRHYLGQTLPSYMVPSAFVALDQFPLTPNGKIDRKALPAPIAERSAETTYVAPRTPLEERLATIWQEVLGIPVIGVTDDFFELGATSVVAATLFARIEHELGNKLPLAPVFQAPTIESLARLLNEAPERQRWTSLVPIQPGGSKPPIFCVHGGAGTILHLQPLARHLGADQPFYGLQARGLYGGAPPLQTVEQMAAHYLSELRDVQPHGPYYLAGYCFGAIVAFEMAQRLLSQDEEVNSLTMFNGPSPSWIHAYGLVSGQPSRVAQRPPPPPTRPLPSRVIGVLTSPTKIRRWGKWLRWRIQVRAVDPVRLRVDLSLRRPLSEGLRETHFLNICGRAQYRYEPEPYPGPVVIFHGEGLYDDPELGWSDCIADIRSYAVPGDHEGNRDAMAEPAVVFVAHQMQELLALARGGALAATRPAPPQTITATQPARLA